MASEGGGGNIWFFGKNIPLGISCSICQDIDEKKFAKKRINLSNSNENTDLQPKNSRGLTYQTWLVDLPGFMNELFFFFKN